MDRLKNNWQWKLISLIIGFFLWSYVMAEVNPSQTISLREVPIEVFNEEYLSEQELVLSDLEPKKVNLTVTGKRNTLASLQSGSVRAYVDVKDLSSRTEGVRTLTLRFSSPDGVNVTSGELSQSTATIERIISQDIPIHIETKGDLENSYILSNSVATPENVQVSGPRSAVEHVDHIRALVDISGLESEKSTNIPIQAVDADGKEVKGVRTSSTSVNIALSILKTKEVPVEIATEGKTDSSVSIRKMQITPNTVMIKGPKEIIDGIKKVTTQPINVEHLNGNKTVEAHYQFPEGVSAVDNSLTPEVSIEVEKLEEKIVQVVLSHVEKRNIPAGKKVEWTNPNLSVYITLRGYPSVLHQLDVQKLKWYVDCSSLSEGKTNLTLFMDKEEGVELKSSSPALLEANVTE